VVAALIVSYGRQRQYQQKEKKSIIWMVNVRNFKTASRRLNY